MIRSTCERCVNTATRNSVVFNAVIYDIFDMNVNSDFFFVVSFHRDKIRPNRSIARAFIRFLFHMHLEWLNSYIHEIFIYMSWWLPEAPQMGNFNNRFMLAFRRTVGMTNGIVVAADWSIMSHLTCSLVPSFPLNVQFSCSFFFFTLRNWSFFFHTHMLCACDSCTFTIILLSHIYCRCI